MGLRVRKSVGLGPVRVNLGKRGVSSVSTRLGPVTMNSRRGPTVRLAPRVSWSPTTPRPRPATRRIAAGATARKEPTPAGAAGVCALLATIGLAFLIGPWAILAGSVIFVGLAMLISRATNELPAPPAEDTAAIRARTAANQAAMEDNFRRWR